MQGAVKERWMELCERAATEQDSVKLIQLVEEINRLLEEKEERNLAKHPPQSFGPWPGTRT